MTNVPLEHENSLKRYARSSVFPVVMTDILWLMLTATAAPAVKKSIYIAPIFTVSLFKKNLHSHGNGQWKRGQHLLQTVEKQTDNKSHYLPAVLSKRCEATRWALQISRDHIVGLWLRNQRLLWAVGLRRNIYTLGLGFLIVPLWHITRIWAVSLLISTIRSNGKYVIILLLTPNVYYHNHL